MREALPKATQSIHTDERLRIASVALVRYMVSKTPAVLHGWWLPAAEREWIKLTSAPHVATFLGRIAPSKCGVKLAASVDLQ